MPTINDKMIATLQKKRLADTPTPSIWGNYTPYNPTDQEIQWISQAEASANEPYFAREKGNLARDINLQHMDIIRLLWYSKTDYATNLAKTNTTFANAMSKATKAYWNRWLLWSWVMKANALDNTSSLNKDLYNMKDYQRRKEEWYATQRSNLKTKFKEGMVWLNEAQDFTNYYNTIKNVNEKKQAYIQDYANTQVWLPTTPTTWNTDLINRVKNVNWYSTNNK